MTKRPAAIVLLIACAAPLPLAAAPPARAAAPQPLAAAPPPAAECRFEKMLKVVYREVTPGLRSDAAAGKPTTMYRFGARYGRLEESADPGAGMHALIVVSEPDAWMVNRADGTIQHVVDPGPTFDFHAPILPGDDVPDDLKGFEFGCEIAFMTTRVPGGARKVQIDGETVGRWDFESGRFQVSLFVDVGAGRPRSVFVRKDGIVSHAIRYLSWEQGLEPDLALFEEPTTPARPGSP